VGYVSSGYSFSGCYMTVESFVYSFFIGRYSRSLNSSPFLMIKGLFKSNIMLFNGPKETRRVHVRDLEIFYIFCFCR